MHEDIKKSEEPKHAPPLHQEAPAAQFGQGRDREGDQQKPQPPVAGRELHRLHRVGAEAGVERAVREAQKRREAGEKEQDARQKFFLKSMPL